MRSADDIIQALTRAGGRLDETRVWEAYQAVVRLIETYLTRQPFVGERALTDTQLIFIRHGLRALDAAALAEIGLSAARLTTALEGRTEAVEEDETKPMAIATPKPSLIVDDVPTYDVYLIGCRRDGRNIRRIAAELSGATLSVWTDAELSQGTAEWRDAVEAAIKASAAVVVVLSPHAKTNTWVDQQLHYALALNLPIFPLLAHGSPAESLPACIAGYEAADIRREPLYRSSLRRLKRALLANKR